MGIGGCVLLAALGAVLAFAVDWEPSGVNLHMVGWILLVAGLLGLLVNATVLRRRRHGGRVGPDEVVEERRYYE
ncbi:DUF6458 family protein [Kitasatospora purpeofusca]|uniref:DUF6458 family protein n=1 Tax=Kitasatospora purpeofusca TaxID=67352 RepID=UPI0004C0E63F|nr:DUF6458 family protein [Kitasatospora purpeofusca]